MPRKDITLGSEQPPSYESLDITSPRSPTQDKVAIKTNPSSPTDLEYEDWVRHTHPCVSIWSRRFGTRIPNHVNISFGISHDEEAIAPDIFFTCNFQPRRSDNIWRDKEDIKKACCTVTAFTKLHRDSGRHYCECDWVMLKNSKHVCLGDSKRWRQMYKWLQALKARRGMRKHDKLCSCGCFDHVA